METVKRVPIVQQVVKSIKDFIFSGEVKEGDKLPSEKVLCERLGVGRGTIREAFRILEATGYVELRPGRGAFAASTKELELQDVAKWFSEHEVETKDFNEVRMAIEPIAVRLAIARCTEEEIVKLKEIHEKFKEAVANNDVSEMSLYDEDFHTTIAKYSRNKLLISICEQVNKYIRDFRSKTFCIRANAQNALSPHSQILEAFMMRDSEYGEQNMKRHLKYVEEALPKSKGEKD